MDYSSWVRRAERFVRQLNYLPGNWGISVAVDPPLSETEADDLHETLPFGLPDPLRAFYVTGSGSCRCRYSWRPVDTDLTRISEVFPSQYTVYGGARIIPARELEEAHEINAWHDPVTEEEVEKHLESIRESLEAEGRFDTFAENFRRIWVTDEQEGKPDNEAIQVWRETVPFVAVGNGDYLALHVGGDQLDFPVVYLCHDDGECPVTRISPSFERFMADWEKLCYVGPEIWLLNQFLEDSAAGELLAEQAKARRWREIVGSSPD